MRKRSILLTLGLVLLVVSCLLAQETQERYTYQRSVRPDGAVRYTETFEQRTRDLDDSTYHTTTRTVTPIDKAQKIAQLTAERAYHISIAQDLQQRITALSALP